jgi:Xaa-Pro aminopeptidase
MTFDPITHAERRAAVFAELERRGGGVMLLPSAGEKLRNSTNEHLFRQDSDFHYLTGLEEPDSCALLSARPGERRFLLFVRPRDKEKEIWNGRRVGVEGATALLKADAAFTMADLEAELPRSLDGAATLWYRLGCDAAWDQRVIGVINALRGQGRAGKRPPAALADPGPVIHEQRLLKRPDELALLRKAADLTAEGHFAAMRDGSAGRREFQVQAEIEYAFRRRGAVGPGYGTIVAAGANSTILHYRAGDDELRDGQVCLVDAGGEYGLYTADVTRTFPVSGKFSGAQRDLYQACLSAQAAAIAAVKPGATIDGLHALTVRVLTEGLVGLGLLPGPVEARVAEGDALVKLTPGSPEEKSAPKGYRKYYMHRTSHWLGMDVHDVGEYVVGGASRPLVPGMVLTVEPGLYVAEDDETAPAALRGVGIRIEDDLLVTASGHENLTAGVPKEIADVEAACTR